MLPVVVALTALVTFASCQTHYKHGPTFGWRRGRTPYIISAETTVWPNTPPNPHVARLAIWPGMDTGKGLIQPILVSTPSKEYPACRHGQGQWCVFASYLKYPSTQKMGAQFAMNGNASLVVKFDYREAAGGYDQKLILNGKVMSEITSNTGKAKTYYTDVECQGKHVGVIKAHRYTNTKIVLSQADPQWGNTPSNHLLACADRISSPDSGKTWLIPTIKVSESVAMRDFEGKGKAGPIICPK